MEGGSKNISQNTVPSISLPTYELEFQIWFYPLESLNTTYRLLQKLRQAPKSVTLNDGLSSSD